MKQITLVTLFPEALALVQDIGVVGKAVRSGLCEVNAVNIRDFAVNSYGTVDDRPYGGGPGMVMRVEPLVAAIRAAKKVKHEESSNGKKSSSSEKELTVQTILLSPQGRMLDTELLKELLDIDHLVLVAGRYEGVDERVCMLEVDREISIGDYVLTGGELPALVIMDALIRRLPGVVGNSESVVEESFEADCLDYPHYTRPPVFEGLKVPEVLCSGDHAAIKQWREAQQLERTRKRRPDLLC